MNYKFLSFVIALLVLGLANITVANPNAKGWDKATWGMKKSVVQNIYKADKINLENDKLIIGSKKIGDKDFRIVFNFTNEKLNEIILILKVTDYSAYQNTLKDLTIKYGKPELTNIKSALWGLKFTTIQLEYQNLGDGIMQLVVINYKQKIDSGL